MSNKIIEVGLEKTIATEKTETQKKNTDGADRKREKIEKGYGCMGKNSERKYKAVSRNGDTLELSQAGSRLGDKGDAGGHSGAQGIGAERRRHRNQDRQIRLAGEKESCTRRQTRDLRRDRFWG